MNETAESEKITVNKVCQDFRVREDGALANKLQDEEFQKHYCMNKNERKSVRTDVRVAKQTYLEEVRTAQLLPEDEIGQMEETDKWLAKDLQEKLHSEERREMSRQAEIETHDAKIAKDLQQREKQKFDKAWIRKKEQEEEERRHLQRTMDEINQREQDTRRRHANPVSEPIAVNGHTDGVQRRARRTNSKEDKRRSTGSGSSGGSVGKEERRQKHWNDCGDGAVVALPTTENGGGGRLETDRIILADGTAIDLFENEEDRQKALRVQRVKKDGEYAKMLQDQERRIVEAEKMASEDRRVAMEEQDRELARHLQRKEYHRLKKEQKERQMRRANSVPSDRHSMNIEDPRRLPSYEEAVVHRNQMPDLLPGHDFNSENLQERSLERSSTHSSRATGSHCSPSLERMTNPEKEGIEYATREKGRMSSRGPPGHQPSVEYRTSSSMEERHRSDRENGRSRGRDCRENRPQSPTGNRHHSRDYRMDSKENRRPSGYENTEKEQQRYDDKDAPVWLTRKSVHSSNSSSQERYEYPENNHGSSRSSYASSGQSSCDRRSQTSGSHTGSPNSRADAWERFDDDESYEESRNTRPSRSRTVASSPPHSDHEKERPLSYNVVEGIDPTFKRERKNSDEESKDQNPEDKAKVIPLIKPHRRKSNERKRDRAADRERMEKENCKQQ